MFDVWNLRGREGNDPAPVITVQPKSLFAQPGPGPVFTVVAGAATVMSAFICR